MRIKGRLACLVFVLAVVESAYASPIAAASNVPPRVFAAAKEWFHRFQIGAIDRTQLDARINAELTESMIEDESARLKSFGTPLRFVYLGSNKVQYTTGYNFVIIFRAAKVVEAIAFDDDGKIAGIDFQPIASTSTYR